jgi:hypothetical protein
MGIYDLTCCILQNMTLHRMYKYTALTIDFIRDAIGYMKIG